MKRHRIGLPCSTADPDCPACHGFGTVVRASFVKACPCVPPLVGSSADSAAVAGLLDGLGVSR